MLPTVPSRSMASITASRLCEGSPMPMNTTFFTGLSVRASATCATISALPTCRIKPSRPVMQNTQPTAQPTWLETHRPSRGSSTLSTVWPSCRPTNKRAEPSCPGCCSRKVAKPASVWLSAGKASRTAVGMKLCSGLRPLSCALAWTHKRSTRCSCSALAPKARKWSRMS